MEQNLEFVIQHIEDKKVPVIAAYDVRELSTFADVFVLAIAKNDPQINAIMNSFREAVKNKENNILTIEGEPKDGWVAIQYNEICAHIFLQKEHELYRLDELFAPYPQIKF